MEVGSFSDEEAVQLLSESILSQPFSFSSNTLCNALDMTDISDDVRKERSRPSSKVQRSPTQDCACSLTKLDVT